MQLQQVDVPLEVFRKRRAALNPVSTVQVFDPVHMADLSAVDVPTDHAVHVGLTGNVHHPFLELGDILDCRLGLEFEMRRHRPITEAESPPDAVEMQIEFENPVVKT